MWIEELVLQDFRNYSHQRVTFSPHMNLIIGENGEGKTNLLEAVFVLATTKSHRTNADKDLVRFSASHYYLGCRIHLTRREEKVELGYSLERKQKLAKLSGMVLPRLSELVGCLNVVLFSPEDLDLVKGSPHRRRRFVDILLSQMDRAYLSALQQYNRILSQRNECLRLISMGKFAVDVLDTWDEQLSITAKKICSRRAASLEEVGQLFCAYATRISEKEKLSIRYCQAFPFETEQQFLQKLRSNRHRDIQRGSTPIGPHRDDLMVLINGRVAANYASQGQQRTSVLALKLAELEFLRRSTKEAPILLLDDVFSELDEVRKAALVSVLASDVQSLLTGTRDNNFASLLEHHSAKILNVEQGKVI